MSRAKVNLDIAAKTYERQKKLYAEGAISQAVRRTGIRRARYTGLAKTHLGHALAATAINLVRLDAWLTDSPLGKTRTSRLATLDLAA